MNFYRHCYELKALKLKVDVGYNFELVDFKIIPRKFLKKEGIQILTKFFR